MGMANLCIVVCRGLSFVVNLGLSLLQCKIIS